jgi:uncharacterized membrane protein YoaK (UPF0700 family)
MGAGLMLKMNNGAPLAIGNGVKVAGAPPLSIDDSLCAKLLPFVLSVAAGSVDIIGFLGLDGLFTAHVTGNVVVLAAKLVAHEEAPVADLISVPVFMVVLALTAVLAAGLKQRQIPTLLPLLLLQFLLLSAFFAISFAAGERIDPNTAGMIFAGMLGVSAMAVQNALVRLSLAGAPSTAVMTTNITNFTIDVAEMLLGCEPGRAESARDRARRTWPAIVGFLLGCALGAAIEPAFGLRSLALPASFALLSLALGAAATLHHALGHPWKWRAI